MTGMARKSGIERISDTARHIKALKDIVKALMNGGWQAAAIQALKHYWPQILGVALILFFLPVIVFCCLPAMLFGFSSSAHPAISSLNSQADSVSGCYDRYGEFCRARVEEIKSNVAGGQSENAGGDDTVHQPEAPEPVVYEMVLCGEPMEKNWFIALHSVSAGNDLNAMSEQSVRDFIAKSIVYTVEDKPEESGNAASDTVPTDGSDAEDSDGATKILTIRYLTPAEFMTEYGYSDADRNWVQLMYRTLQNGNASQTA